MGAERSDAARARKSAGRFDTPPSLARLVARLGLTSALDVAKNTPDPARALLAIRVCDPTCGEGNLLLEAARLLASALAQVRAEEPSSDDHRRALTDVIRSCLRGVERDPAVAARCRESLAREGGFEDAPAWLEEAVVTDDAASIACEGRWARTFTDAMARGGFDAVIGNPPFLNAIERRAATTTREALRALHPEIGATADVACHFLAIAETLRRASGRVAMVMPRALLSAPAAEKLRERLTPSMRVIYAPDAARLFDGAHVFVCVVATGAGDGCDVSADPDPARVSWRRVELRDSAWWAALHGGERPLDHGAPTLSERFELSASMTASEAYELAPLLVDAPHGAGIALVTTGLIDRGACHWGARPCRYLKQSFAHPRVDPSRAVPAGIARRIARAARPKLLVAGLGREIECFVDARGDYLGAVSTWTVTHPADDLAALRALADHLHSDAVGARLRAELGATALGGGSITLTRRFLDAIPLPPAKDETATARGVDGPRR